MPLNKKGFWLVGLGGAFGTLLRLMLWEIIGLANDNSALWLVLFINIFGAFVLGALTSYLRFKKQKTKIQLSLLMGTGFLGSFTTFSTFIQISASLTPLYLGLYALAMSFLGLFFATLGLALGKKLCGCPR